MADITDSRPPVWTGHVSLNTTDVGSSVRFYEQLGMRRVAVFEQFAALEMRGGTHLAIRQDPGPAVPGPVGWDLMVDDIDATHARWQAEAVPVSEIVMEAPHRCFNVTDPDGHIVTVRDTHVVGPV
jgi:catechol 2,3-dioxygenase-like lactoylglutathione lyase family enzyme